MGSWVIGLLGELSLEKWQKAKGEKKVSRRGAETQSGKGDVRYSLRLGKRQLLGLQCRVQEVVNQLAGDL
jgi:hypothetical protein